MSIYIPHNILITGIGGFIGSNFLLEMVKKYKSYNFIGIDIMSYCSSMKNFEEIMNYDNFIFIKTNINNLNFLNYIFKKYNIDTVIHFAAYTHVDDSFGNSINFTKNNVLGTHILLEVSNKNNIKRFIHVSTDEVYGNNNNNISNENTLLEPTNPYAASKASAEHIVKSYYKSFNLPIIITRSNNIYGPKQYPEKVIPKFILRLNKNLKCNIHGYGNQFRSFLFIDDLIKAFDIILHCGLIGETYNIGCENEYSIIDVSKKLIKKIKNTENYEEWINYVEDRCFNDQRYKISNKKIKKLGWKQEINFNQGLNKTIEWYLNNLNYWNNDTINQIINK